MSAARYQLQPYRMTGAEMPERKVYSDTTSFWSLRLYESDLWKQALQRGVVTPAIPQKSMRR